MKNLGNQLNRGTVSFSAGCLHLTNRTFVGLGHSPVDFRAYFGTCVRKTAHSYITLAHSRLR